jgi:hypothetical protein
MGASDAMALVEALMVLHGKDEAEIRAVLEAL